MPPDGEDLGAPREPGRSRDDSARGRRAAGAARRGDLFVDDYARVLAPFHTETDTRTEVASLREMLGLAQDERVLDLACGWGRHLALLRHAGHRVTGVDLSEPLLRRAAALMLAGHDDDTEHEPERGRDSPLCCATMLALPFAAGTFDVVLNLATSLGLFLDDRPARRALAEAGRVLRPGGRLLLEGMHREEVEPGFAARDRWVLEDGTVVRARRRLDRALGISHEVLRWEGPAGGGALRHSLRLRTGAETAALVESAGLEVVEAWGDWAGEPFTPASERLILLARRR